nr:MAG TPA: shufflon protein [Caudoviricetes sp.]
MVSKKTPFATADNAGIYDTIAENFRYLKDELDNITDTGELSSIRDEVKNMYEQMKTDGNFGEVAAKAQAQEALKQAKAAAESASKASASEQNVQNNTVVANNLLEDVKTKISETKSMLDRIKERAKAGEAKLQEAETREQNVRTMEESVKASETNVVSMTSEVNSALTEIRTSKKNVEDNTDAVQRNTTEVQGLTTETRDHEAKAKESATVAQKWAQATDSPDGVVDIESPSGKTESSRSWAIESKKKATDAIKALEAVKDLHATVMSAKEVAVKAEQSAKAIQSIVDVAMGTAQQALADIQAIQKTIVSSVAWKGVVESYSDLPQNPERGWIYCIKTANEEHNVRAGDCLIWNGTSWDNAGKFVDMTQFAKIGDNVKFGEINGYTTPEGTGTFVVTNGNETRLGNTLKVGNITVSETSSGLDFTSENGQAYLGVKTAASSTSDTANNANKLGGKTLQEIGNIITDVQNALTSSISKAKQDGDNAIKSAIDSIRGMSPDALNTLQKIASAINNDANFATTIASALDGKVSKSGDTMEGVLTLPIVNLYKGYIEQGKRDTGDAISDNGGANINIASWFGLGFYSTYEKKYTGSMDLRNGNWRTLGAMTAKDFYAEDWFRAKGDNGFYFENHGGGWHMIDNEWIRAFNGKNIYTSGKIRCDAGFEGTLRGTADNANKLGGYTLEQVIAMAKR